MVHITKHTSLRGLIIVSAIVVLAFAVDWIYMQKNSSAADMSKFDPGNIMSDVVMSNKSTMSVESIQNFLKSKNSCDDTRIYRVAQNPGYHYNVKDGKFVCMADESFNGESAAQIIWQAAQDYNINPQVLIVLLEKEQGLVTDTWPNHIQYRSATGFGCPDTAACDSQYFGLKNQIRQAARLFRTVLDGGWSNYPVGWTYVQYHPYSWCGGTTINIQNRATSALYRYTPYQPNQAALNNQYGTGDSCSAYGNRNFWRLFRDWFGSTQGYNWHPMDTSRWMQVADDSQKLDLNTNVNIGETITAGRQLRFVDKATMDGIVYLRTQWDYDHNINNGIPLDSLLDIEYTKIDPEWRMINFDGVHKYIARQQAWVGVGNASAQFPIGTIVKVVDSITIDGIVSYRTEYDSKLGLDLTFSGERLSPLTSIQPLDTPRDMQSKSDINPINIDGDVCPTISKYSIIHIAGKVIYQGAVYFSEKDSWQSSSDFCLIPPRDLYWEAIGFDSFDSPRSMKLKSDTRRINAYTGETVDILKSGRIIHFSTKTAINGSAYYRTTYSGDLSEPYVIPASSLTEL